MTNFDLKWNNFSLTLGKRTCIMGILNTTPDSFSDGGRYLACNDAVEQGLRLAAQGADILDIGGESSRPFATPVSVDEELDRVIPVIEKLSSLIDIPISIDTVKAKVAEDALNAGASIINDITALERDPQMVHLAAKTGVPVILMHMKGSPEDMQINPQYEDFLREIRSYLEQRVKFAVDSGISPDLIILDPGIGFGKTVEHNLMLIKHLEEIADIGFPLLLGPSRKSFVQKIIADNISNRGHQSDLGNSVKNIDKTLCNIAAKEPVSKIIPSSPVNETGTMAAVAASIMKGAHIVRVHDVAAARVVADIINAIQGV